MQAFWSHPAVMAIEDAVLQLLWLIEHQLRSVEAMTWILVALASGAVWMFWVRPPK
jgi:hypothetical protein